jgi:putative oxidoreductase
VLGIIFLIHGLHKVVGWDGAGGLAQTVAGMTAMGMPLVAVYMLAFGELLGGIALIVGFLSRLAALGILIIMLGAVFMVHLPHGFFLNWYNIEGVGHGFEYNLALIAMSLAVIFGGAGCCSLDSKICKKG